MLRQLCGDKLKNFVLVTNMWGTVSREVGEAREKELSGRLFRQALGGGARMVRHHDTAQSAHDIIRGIVVNRPAVSQVQRNPTGERRHTVHTTAGEVSNRKFNEQTRQYLDKVRRDATGALEERGEMKEESEKGATRRQEGMGKMTKDPEGTPTNYAGKARTEVRVMEMERGERQHADLGHRLQNTADAPVVDVAGLGRKARTEKQRAESELGNLDRRLEGATDVFAAERARLEQEAREKIQRAEAEHKRQLTDLERRLRDAADAAATAERQKLEKRTKELQGQVETTMEYSEALEVKMKEMERRGKEMERRVKEKEQVEDELKRQLAVLTRRSQDETNASAAQPEKLERKIKKLKDRAATTTTTPPRPASYVQVFFYLATRDG